MVISKQKNILALVGSNHINGFTRNIIQLLKDNLHARNENIDFQIIDTTEIDINVCRGCNTCFEKGLCPLDRQDDMGQLKAIPFLDKQLNEFIENIKNVTDEEKKAMLDNADVIILACPVYLMHVSSPMKILLDRLSYWCHLLKLRNKLLVTVITTSRSGANETNNYLKYIGSGMGLLPISEIIFTHSSDIDELIHKINKSAYIINQYLIEKKEIHSNQFLEETFAIEKLDKSLQLDSSFEKQYWQSHGLFNCSSFEDVLSLEKERKK